MIMLKNKFFSGCFFLVLSAVLLMVASCSKATIEQAQQSALQTYFEDNFLNKDYKVHLAVDNGSDITSQYSGFIFRLNKGTSFDGPIIASKNSVINYGTWSSNADYSKLTITLPNTVSEFVFLIREWRFTRKGIPILELAPWGTTEAKVLHMERQ